MSKPAILFPPDLLSTMHRTLHDRQERAYNEVKLSAQMEMIVSLVGRTNYQLTPQKLDAMYPKEIRTERYFDETRDEFEISVSNCKSVADDLKKLERNLKHTITKIVEMVRSVISQDEDISALLYQKMMWSYAKMMKHHFLLLPALYFFEAPKSETQWHFSDKVDAYIYRYVDLDDEIFPSIPAGPLHGHESTTALFDYKQAMERYKNLVDADGNQLEKIQALTQIVKELGRVLFVIPNTKEEMDKFSSLFWWMELNYLHKDLFSEK